MVPSHLNKLWVATRVQNLDSHPSPNKHILLLTFSSSSLYVFDEVREDEEPINWKQYIQPHKYVSFFLRVEGKVVVS